MKYYSVVLVNVNDINEVTVMTSTCLDGPDAWGLFTSFRMLAHGFELRIYKSGVLMDFRDADTDALVPHAAEPPVAEPPARLEHLVPATHYIVRSQVTERGKLEDYVRTDDLDAALACAERLVGQGQCIAAEVRADTIQATLIKRFARKK